ncbi:substrate-binding domain-containing protein [Nonomuraea sp. NPDC052116]|uniref:substrate-binding domain-containing protein n=1 Tax=Nonomuraea sp. NPDC052116 TaxID=3155665 RepID=UPI00342F63EB
MTARGDADRVRRSDPASRRQRSGRARRHRGGGETADRARRSEDPHGGFPLIGSQLVARAFSAVCDLPAPRDLVLREANMEDLREGLLAGQLDVILIPAVAPLPRFEHRIIEVEPIVVVGSSQEAPLEVGEAGGEQFILVPDSCGLTTFTRQLFAARALPLRTYPGEAGSYRVLEEWASMGLGAAMLPRSKLTSPDVRSRPLVDDGRAVEISYEAVWSAGSSLGADLAFLVDRLAASR